MQLLIRAATGDEGESILVAPNGTDWKYVEFRVVRVPSGKAYSGNSGACEVVLVFIEGTANVRSTHGDWNGVGGRATPFDGPPQAIYLPPGSDYTLRASTDVEVAVCGAVANGRAHPARLLALNERDGHDRGRGQARRRIYDLLMQPGSASALFITEVHTPPGNWSSYPPHKHDVDDPPRESQLEEIYYYRVKPKAGFALQRIYSADGELDETVTAGDRDAVLVPRGYHVCAAAPGYAVYYLNVLAGPRHLYHLTFDPAHAWIKEGWTW
jgi:5-deoxy-glucuronate isomerase